MSTKEKNEKQRLGAFGESFVQTYITRALGWNILHRNWRCRHGEIDIVASSQRAVILVEVRTRRGTAYGTPLESVESRKVNRLWRLAEVLLTKDDATRQVFQQVGDVRLDVVGLRVNGRYVCELCHVRNAIDFHMVTGSPLSRRSVGRRWDA